MIPSASPSCRKRLRNCFFLVRQGVGARLSRDSNLCSGRLVFVLPMASFAAARYKAGASKICFQLAYLAWRLRSLANDGKHRSRFAPLGGFSDPTSNNVLVRNPERRGGLSRCGNVFFSKSKIHESQSRLLCSWHVCSVHTKRGLVKRSAGVP